MKDSLEEYKGWVEQVEGKKSAILNTEQWKLLSIEIKRKKIKWTESKRPMLLHQAKKH